LYFGDHIVVLNVSFFRTEGVLRTTPNDSKEGNKKYHVLAMHPKVGCPFVVIYYNLKLRVL
jgi:hypothetical protein